jgi:hypothetical protein
MYRKPTFEQTILKNIGNFLFYSFNYELVESYTYFSLDKSLALQELLPSLFKEKPEYFLKLVFVSLGCKYRKRERFFPYTIY